MFKLEKQFSFYKQYHTNVNNRRVHYVCVPILFVTALAMLTDVPLPSPISNVARLVCALYVVHGFILDPLVGILHGPVMILYFVLSQSLRSNAGPSTFFLPLLIHLVAWFAQFVAHRVFEKRAPALTDSLIQALTSASVVLWLEIMFSLGFLPELKARLARAPAVSKARKAVAAVSSNPTR